MFSAEGLEKDILVVEAVGTVLVPGEAVHCSIPGFGADSLTL
jgi:hypothetical protein